MSTTSELLVRIAEPEHRLGPLEAARSVERLHYQYGYCLDKCYYAEVADLFTDEDPSVYFLRGLFKGKDGVRRLYTGRLGNRFADAANGPSYGRLLDHPQMQPVVTVAPDLLGAKARFRSIMQAGTHHTLKSPRQWWEGGVYENVYVRGGETWKIKLLNGRPVWRAEFDDGWMRADPDYDGYLSIPYPEDPYGPDEIVGDWQMFPEAETVPFHYTHPVTGKTVGQVAALPYCPLWSRDSEPVRVLHHASPSRGFVLRCNDVFALGPPVRVTGVVVGGGGKRVRVLTVCELYPFV